MTRTSRRRIAFRRLVAVSILIGVGVVSAAYALPARDARSARHARVPRATILPARRSHRHIERASPVALLRLPAQLPTRIVSVPILMYHRIDAITAELAPITRALTVSPGVFAAQMQWLHDHGFHAITQLQLFDALERGTALPTKPVMITFDDGYRDVLWHAAPTLARLHMPATAYVITGRVSGPDPSFLTWEELRRLEALGVEIGSHTVHHLELPYLSDQDASAELDRSRQALEQHLGHPVQWFAYPSGAETAHAAGLVAQAGYVLAVTTQPGSSQQADEPLALHRFEILDTTGVSGLAALVGP